MTVWKRDLGRSVAILAMSSGLGLAANGLSARPVPLLKADGPGAWRDRAPRMTGHELRTAWEGNRAILLLDVRSREAFDRGHASRALHAPAQDFLAHYERLGLAYALKAAEGIVVVCDSEDCHAADRVAMLLMDLGHRPTWVLQGGWDAGRREGLGDARP
jgi:rhodanese-related sulfurtransferase